MELNGYEINGFKIPDRMIGGINRYLRHGILPGGFLQAIISNDLERAVVLADEENIRNLPAYVYFFRNEAPSFSWGSREKMNKYAKK